MPIHNASPDPAPIAALRRRLVRWYREHCRDLPWRRHRTPYAIWISEIMLQQTRVETVVPYYNTFLKRFPNIKRLAQAPLADVLKAWAGLGYYSRARNLHQAAQQVCQSHAARFPREPAAVLALPGIGRYTAGAILSIAFDQQQPIVDGNVMRVFSRLFAMQESIETTPARNIFWQWATLWAATNQPGEANQALMELGALVCTQRTPTCSACPLQSSCESHRLGVQDQLPRRKSGAATVPVELAALLLRQRGRILLVQRDEGRLLQDYWEMPTALIRVADETTASPRWGRVLQSLRRVVAQRSGYRVSSWIEHGQARHGILQNRIRIHVLEAVLAPRRSAATTSGRATFAAKPRSMEDAPVARRGAATPLDNLLLRGLRWRWTTAAEARHLPLTTVARKSLQVASRLDSSWKDYSGQQPAEKAPRQRRNQPAH